ncbi:hypothetical protein ASG47_13995 [Devosia sp. Leaf420]|uniref:DUF3060 domain-containing protein n=1 Tax=Devosia sp. Leaf420 TaxID=1736374 RepID=UPI0007135CD4|nr:DUF3060 domain-containing protein [Devosia sp. Leaf420]KQT46044.1 hypothetical protein ASG47_13995 [Devosia sp. Leaf420]
MRLILSITLLAALPVAAFAQVSDTAKPEEVVIEGVGLTRTVPCDGLDVGIYGADNQIDLTGTCGQVVVHGDGHTVHVEDAATIAISGIGHTVNADKVSTLSIDTTENTVNATMDAADDAAKVSINGAEQTANLTLKSKTTIDVQGTEQVVNWDLGEGAPEPRIDIGGIDNAVNRME